MNEKTKNPLSIKWQAPEFIIQPKNARWYFMITMVAILLVIVFIYLGVAHKQSSYYLAAGVVVAATFALFSQNKAQPNTSEFHISDEGVDINGRLYSWEALSTFWIVEHTINFEQKKKISLPLSAPLGEQDPINVREFLLKYLPEKSYGGEMVSDKINRLFGL